MVGIVLAGAPSCGAIHAVAPSVYREVVAGSNACRGASYGTCERLDRKLSRAVLRGRGGSNASLLPDPLISAIKETSAFWKKEK
jgi:hypothetical protein